MMDATSETPPITSGSTAAAFTFWNVSTPSSITATAVTA
jgi:hypothetical protein